MPAPTSILGTRVLRTEDPALLTGSARYVPDLDLDAALHAVFVRSTVAHGAIRSIDTAEAAAMPGVVAVWTADELDVAPHHGFMSVHDDFVRPPLAAERVRFVGEAVAVVFADTTAQGVDAAEMVYVDIDPLPVVVDPETALADDAEVLFPERGSNRALDIVDPPFDLEAHSDTVVRGRYLNQRIAVASMEPDGFAAAPSPDGRLVVWPSTQMPHGLHPQLAGVLGIDVADVHVITPQVGGGFGGKAGMHHEYTAVAKAALAFDRPVVWVPTRTEDMHTLPHSRAQIQYAELGCRTDGTFTGLRVRLIGDGGAYPGIGALLPGGTKRMSHGIYDFGTIQFDVAVAATNTSPTGAYRGAGRPEATALLERVVDQAAHELGIDPIELREKNLLGDDIFPFSTLTGLTYDSGAYRTPLRVAAEAVGYDALRAEQARRRDGGDTKLLGVGVATYVEITAGGGSEEYGRVEINPDGSATIFAGTSAHGQGHQTAYAMLVADQTGIPVGSITLVDGDTDRVPQGGGTGGSRSLQLAGPAVAKATAEVVDAARDLAARVLEAAVDDIVVDTTAGTVGVIGVPASALTWAELATHAGEADEPLQAESIFEQDGATFPFGAHIAVVEVDTETGEVTMVRHVAVDDCGTVLNPVLVEGQQHGGIAAGASQALYEEIRYDDQGTLLTANFADYGLPSAAEFCSFEAHSTETATPLNPLGAKGIGEAATIGSTPAVQNAVIDAVAHLGVRHIDMPCTAEKVWRAIRDATEGTLADPWRDPPAVFTAGEGLDDAQLEAAEGI